MDIIRDNRIVGDVTFAARLRDFLSAPETDPLREGERRYLLGVAERLLGNQTRTATNEYERAYLSYVNRKSKSQTQCT